MGRLEHMGNLGCLGSDLEHLKCLGELGALGLLGSVGALATLTVGRGRLDAWHTFVNTDNICVTWITGDTSFTRSLGTLGSLPVLTRNPKP